MPGLLLSKLRSRRGLERIFRERLSEPIHLNLISLFVALFGSVRAKVYFDLLVRQQHAFGLLAAAERAKLFGDERVTVIEFGVANGAGLMNLCKLANMIGPEIGVGFDIFGFDTGTGMPEPIDYRDHPESYQPGWYPMQKPTELISALPSNAKLILGAIGETLREFTPPSPIGFVSLDVDYYSSAVDCLTVFDQPAENLQPIVDIYADDVQYPTHNSWCGEMLAMREYSDVHSFRKIEASNYLRPSRLFKNAAWIDHIYTVHVLDHPARASILKGRPDVVLGNPYLKLAQVG